MNGRPYKNMGFSLLPLAFLFLFEPSYVLLDPLPDCIGYILLCFALLNLADLNPRISDAFVGFRRGVLISALRFVAVSLLNSFFVAEEQPVRLLVFVFVFELFELLVLLPAYKSLFEGLLSLGMMQDGTALYTKKIKFKIKTDPSTKKKVRIFSEGQSNVTERLHAFTIASLIIAALCAVLPELTSLIDNSSYEFVFILRLIGMALSLVAGLFWLIQIFCCFAAVRKDTVFIKNLERIYTEKAVANPGFYISRQIRSGLLILFVGALFTADFYVNKQNVIPEVIGYLLFIFGALMLLKFARKAKLVIFLSVIGVLASLLAKISANDFYSQYNPLGVRKDLDVYNAFYSMTAVQAVAAAFLFLTAISLIFLLHELYRKYTDAARALAPREHKRKFTVNALRTSILCAIASFGSVYAILCQPFYEIRDKMLISEGWIYHYSGMIATGLNLAGVVVLCSFIMFVSNSVKERYEIPIAATE